VRRLRVNVDGKLVLNRTCNDDFEFTIEVDGKRITVGEIPKRLITQEPPEIGSQVRAFVGNLQEEVLCTKVAPGEWVFPSNRAGDFKSTIWSHMAVTELVNPAPPKAEKPEPSGIGAVISGDCPHCQDDVYMVRSMGTWMCEVCGVGNDWSSLDHDVVAIHSKGFQ